MIKQDPILMKKVETDNLPQAKSGSLWRLALRQLFRQPSSRTGIILLGALFIIAVFAKQIAPYDPTKMLIWDEDVKRRTSPCIHLLGCPESEPQHPGQRDRRTERDRRVIPADRVAVASRSI